jgi:hypothetical protein
MTLLLPAANLLQVMLLASSDSCRPFLMHMGSHSEAGQLILLINKFRGWRHFQIDWLRFWPRDLCRHFGTSQPLRILGRLRGWGAQDSQGSKVVLSET